MTVKYHSHWTPGDKKSVGCKLSFEVLDSKIKKTIIDTVKIFVDDELEKTYSINVVGNEIIVEVRLYDGLVCQYQPTQLFRFQIIEE